MTQRPDPEPDELELARELERQRPVPAAAFRGALARSLKAKDPGYGPRPAKLRWIVAGYAGGGLAMIVLGALVAVGVI